MTAESPSTQRTCGARAADAAGRTGKRVPLTLLTPKVRRSRSGPRRAAVLIAVHVIVAVHVAQWLYTGMTISPVEPSESMYTLERGLLNAGFVFFALAIVSTLVFGRFFCGWGCHVVALQDLCGWFMKKCGVHPKPFRSRLLVFAPLGLALYMFVWPTARREVIQPAFAAAGTPMPAWIGPAADRPEVHNEFFVRDFWATFPAWYVAIPFLAVCGFATVYFLGSKGFCTYGCPYGGFFGPADTIAPGRILVNDNCEHCGHCTAVCTSNVRVHEEVRDFGMVVDPGCMKCLDCVSVCPNDALRVGFAAPPRFNARAREGRAARAAAKRQRPYDLTWPQEIGAAGVFLVLLLGFRGFLDQVPLLMAAGLAAIGAYGAWKLWSMARVANVRLQNLQLRYRGRWTRAGWVFAPAASAVLLAGAWGLAVRYHLWRGGLLDSQVRLAAAEYMAPGFAAGEADRALAERAIASLTRAGPPSESGIGWTRSADVNRRLASLHAVCGRFDEAERFVRRALVQERPTGQMLDFAGAVVARRGGGPQEHVRVYRTVVERFPAHAPALLALARAEAALGHLAEAAGLASRAAERSDDPGVVAASGALLRDLGALDGAREAFTRAVRLDPRSGVLRAELALVDFLSGRRADGLVGMDRAVEQEPNHPGLHRRRAEMLRALGRFEDAEKADGEASRLEARPPESGK